jgi:hypothetical protein
MLFFGEMSFGSSSIQKTKEIIMKRFSLFALLLVAILAFSFALPAHPSSAQDEEMMGTVACDSDLVLSLYFAEYHYNFGAVYDHMMMDMPDMALPSLELFDKGQFAPLFESMMAMMDEEMMMPESMMDEEMMNSVMDVMGMMGDEAVMMAMMDEMPEGMTVLMPLTVEGESAECAALRAELGKFQTALAYTSIMMMAGEE